jgi:hypothetical protein
VRGILSQPWTAGSEKEEKEEKEKENPGPAITDKIGAWPLSGHYTR